MGLYTITTRASGTTLTATIFNDDHQNHVTHTEPMSINSYEESVAQMDLEVNPLTAAGDPSLPTSIAEEIARLRYAITQLKGRLFSNAAPAHWYVSVTGTHNSVTFPATACRREQATAQSIPNAFAIVIGFDTTIYDTVGTIATGTGLRVPVSGVYMVGTTCGLGDGATTGPTGDFWLAIARRHVGVTTVLATNEVFTDTLAVPKAITVEACAQFTAGDYVQAVVYQSTGSAKLLLSEADARPAIWMALLSR